MRRRPGHLLRRAFRLPVLFYRVGLGGVLGRRFLMLVHRGRETGRTHRTVLEVVRDDASTRESIVVSAYGRGADWYRNIQAAPALEVHVGGTRYVPAQRFLSVDEAERELAAYARRHPRLLRILLRLVGLPDDGGPAGVRAIAGRLPMVAFRPRHPVGGAGGAAPAPRRS